MDLRDFVEDEKFNVFDVEPNHGDQGLGPLAKLIALGDPSQSVLINRCSKLGSGRMPPMGSSTPDARAIGLLMEWTISLKDYQPEKPSPTE